MCDVRKNRVTCVRKTGSVTDMRVEYSTASQRLGSAFAVKIQTGRRPSAFFQSGRRTFEPYVCHCTLLPSLVTRTKYSDFGSAKGV
jgi:hypothetical protein